MLTDHVDQCRGADFVPHLLPRARICMALGWRRLPLHPSPERGRTTNELTPQLKLLKMWWFRKACYMASVCQCQKMLATPLWKGNIWEIWKLKANLFKTLCLLQSPSCKVPRAHWWPVLPGSWQLKAGGFSRSALVNAKDMEAWKPTKVTYALTVGNPQMPVLSKQTP